MTANAWITIACFILANVAVIGVAVGKVLGRIDSVKETLVSIEKRLVSNDDRMDTLQMSRDVHENRLIHLETEHKIFHPSCSTAKD